MENKNAVNQPQKLKKRVSVRGFVNSPWVFLMLIPLIGGFYLVNHPEYVIAAMQYPYALGCVIAIVPVFFVIKLIINFFSVIENWIKLQFDRARQAKRGYFFEIVTAVFMFVSVSEAGPFFNDIQHNVLYGALGYITVLAFDLIAVVCIDARRKELARGGTKAGVYLTGVFVCAIVSMVANLYSALSNFKGPADPSFPGLLKAIAPYVGIMFPVMIVFLAFSRDAEIEVDDAETYKKQQKKRIDYLAAKREMLAQVIHEMSQISLLQEREFFLKSWLFTRKKISFVIEAVTSYVKTTLNEEVAGLKAELQQKEQIIASQVQHIEDLSSRFEGHLSLLNQRYEDLQEQHANMAFHLQQMAQMRDEILDANQGFTSSIERQIDIKIQLANSDLQRQIEQIRMISATNFIAEKSNNSPDLKDDLEVLNSPDLQAEEGCQNTKKIPADFGLNSAEIHALIMAFPGVKKWFDEGLSSVSESEIIDATNIRSNTVRNAVSNRAIKAARGRGNKLQTETILQWLLTRLKRSANKVKNTGEITPEMVALNRENREPNTGELEVINQKNNHHNGNGNGHNKDDKSVLNLPILATE